MLKLLMSGLLCGLVVASATAQDNAMRPRTWGDQGDGTYINPVLPGDFSDPDIVRVGSDYYLIVSTFQYSPGMALMHSKDLVNWQYLGHCIPDVSALGPELNWDRMNRYGRGVYAGAIRHHAGKFWMFYTTMQEGVFMTTATNPAGPWDPPHLVSDSKGWDDNCPFWDDNGEAWMLASKPGPNWFTYCYKMSPDGRSIDLSSETVIDRHFGSEGNKIFKLNGWYYIFHNQIDGPANRTGVFMRAKSMAGPWEKKLFLWGSGSDNDREPNQGALVDAPDGSWWFMTHHGRGDYYDGRPCSLLPVVWVDGWPVVDTKKSAGAGVIVPQAIKPVQGFPAQIPQTSDDFAAPQRQPQWEWNYAPRADKWSLTARPGWLRLEAWPALKPGDFLTVGNTLSQRIIGTGGGEIVVKADVSGMANGQFGGVAAYWGKAGLLGVNQQDGVRRVQLRNDQQTTDGPVITGADIWLKLLIDDRGGCTFAFSTDGRAFTAIGERFVFGWAHYRGTRFGLFTWNDLATAGRIDFDSFRYDVGGFIGPVMGLKRTVAGGPSVFTQPGDYGGSGGFEELPNDAFDGNLATKFHCHVRDGELPGGINSGVLYTPEASRVISGFRFATAADAAGRDPMMVTVEGSNDVFGTTAKKRGFIKLYEGRSGLEQDPGRGAWGQVINFPNATAYKRYRVLVTKARDAGADAVQYAELSFLPSSTR